MKLSKEEKVTSSVDIPVGTFLKRTVLEEYRFIASDKLIIIVDTNAGGIDTRQHFYASDDIEDYEQITRTEFQTAFTKAFAAMQKYHSMIQAAPEFIDVPALKQLTNEATNSTPLTA